MLVFTKCKDQGIKYISKVRNKFCTSLLFKGSKGTIIQKGRETSYRKETVHNRDKKLSREFKEYLFTCTSPYLNTPDS